MRVTKAKRKKHLDLMVDGPPVEDPKEKLSLEARGLLVKKCIVCNVRVVCRFDDPRLPRCSKHINESTADSSVGKVATRMTNGLIHIQWRGHTLGYFQPSEVLILTQGMLDALDK